MLKVLPLLILTSIFSLYADTEIPFVPSPDALLASGIVETSGNVEVRSSVPGTVSRVYIKNGDHVRRGQMLFQLDDKALKTELEVKRAQVEAARTNLTRLEARVAKLRSIRDYKLLSKQELKSRENEVSIAEANLRSAEAAVKQAEAARNFLTVRSPINGIVIQNGIQAGAFVEPGGPAIVIANFLKLYVRAELNEEKASRIDVNTIATLIPKNGAVAIPLRFLKMEPKSENNLEEVPEQEKAIQIIYSFDNPRDSPLYLGQKVDVYFQYMRQ